MYKLILVLLLTGILMMCNDNDANFEYSSRWRLIDINCTDLLQYNELIISDTLICVFGIEMEACYPLKKNPMHYKTRDGLENFHINILNDTLTVTSSLDTAAYAKLEQDNLLSISPCDTARYVRLDLEDPESRDWKEFHHRSIEYIANADIQNDSFMKTQEILDFVLMYFYRDSSAWEHEDDMKLEVK